MHPIRFAAALALLASAGACGSATAPVLEAEAARRDGLMLESENRAAENGGTVGSGYDVSGGTLGSGHVVPSGTTDDETTSARGVNGLGGG
jgi:hypothetical protein